jgi:hypothetical protein
MRPKVPHQDVEISPIQIEAFVAYGLRGNRCAFTVSSVVLGCTIRSRHGAVILRGCDERERKIRSKLRY